VTAQGSSGAIFWRAIERRHVIGAEAAAREIPNLPLDFALALVHLYAEKRDRRYERAALRYLERYMAEAARPSRTWPRWPRCSPNGGRARSA
jgi:hypothetical protein